MVEDKLRLGLTFDDVLLVPRNSNVLPSDVDTSVKLTKKLTLNIPFISAAMDTITEAELAIALANEGGIGIIHKNMPVIEQAKQVKRVKKSMSWMVTDPVKVHPEETLADIKALIEKKGFNSFPVVDKDDILIGMLTNRDIRFKTDPKTKVKDMMTKKVITEKFGTPRETAIKILDKHRIEKLPVVDGKGRIKGLITVTDVDKSQKYPNACKDKDGRLKVGAAVGPFDFERAKALVEAGVDLLVVDTAHGDSQNVINAVKKIKSMFNVDIMAGNVATPDGAKNLISAGADIIKVGVGPGAICTTRVISGVGVPQITAIQDCAKVAQKHDIAIIADGGVRYSGDIAKAIAAGASAVMMGSVFAGCEETPGRVVFVQGRKYKKYRGMGSIGAMEQGSGDRYGQAGSKKFVPEGIEGIVPYKGTISETIFQYVGGLRSAMGYNGCKNVKELQTNGKFIKITEASLRESHPHDVTITEEAPNYQTD